MPALPSDPNPSRARSRRRIVPLLLAIIVAAGALTLLVVAAFPWGVFRGVAETRLAAAVGRPVTIAAIDRTDSLSFTPTIVLRGLRIGRPAGAPAGDVGAGVDLARIGAARLRFRVWPLLIGRFEPLDVAIDDARITLIRAADGRVNWRAPGRPAARGTKMTIPRALRINAARIIYRDAKANRSIDVRLSSDPVRGVRVSGIGLVVGQPVTITARGAPVTEASRGPWQFAVRADGAAIGMSAHGQLAAPLDFAHARMAVHAHADDLKLIDAVIEAGLFGTRSIHIDGEAHYDAPDWSVEHLSGVVGRSDFVASGTIHKRAGRTIVAAHASADRLDFNDLMSERGNAVAAAAMRLTGPMLVPDTRIDLTHLANTDGRLDFEVHHLIGSTPSSLTAIRGHAVLDHQRLVVDPLVVDLTRGMLAGSVRVDQRRRPLPRVTIDLRLTDSSVVAVAGGDGTIDARVDARISVAGNGRTIREAVGRSTGKIGLIARDGTLPARLATTIGFDVGRAFFTDEHGRADLRCVGLGLDLRQGRGVVDPLIVDTSRSQSHGEGEIDFPDERVAITLTGAPKQASILRLPGSAVLTGSIRVPHVVIPPEIRSTGNILKAIGRAITGRQGPEAADADCSALARDLLR